jgi:hypothetical protein
MILSMDSVALSAPTVIPTLLCVTSISTNVSPILVSWAVLAMMESMASVALAWLATLARSVKPTSTSALRRLVRTKVFATITSTDTPAPVLLVTPTPFVKPISMNAPPILVRTAAIASML